MSEQKNQTNVTAALAMVERKVAAGRDYQSANIVMASIQYIESLEARVKELEGEDDGDAREADVRDAGDDVAANGAVS